MADALVFELSKVVSSEIRKRMVAHLPHIDADLAGKVADGLGLDEVPTVHEAAREPITDLPASDALSILKNGPDSFAGRKMGILVTDGIDDATLDGLKDVVTAAGGVVEIVAQKIGGIVTAGGKKVPADQKIDAAPSVLYDAVAILATADGATALAELHPARTFVADAFAHAKFIGHSQETNPLLKAAGIKADDGMMTIGAEKDAKAFVKACAAMRYWKRMDK